MTDAQAALDQVREALAEGSALVEWEWWTSNSFRRLSVRGDTVDGGVMHAYVARDGHPDISIRQSDMALIAACSPTNIAAIIAHVETQKAEIERLRAGLRAVSDLIDESHGVAGLHRNGDVAPWSDLRTGGKYEEWLVSFDDALKEQR